MAAFNKMMDSNLIFASHKTKYPFSTFAIFLILVMGFLSGCGRASGGFPVKPPSQGASTYAVDPIFRDLYTHLGGAKVLGPAISEPYVEGSKKYQFIEAGLFLHDPGAPENMRIQLVPLGLEMGVEEAPVAMPSEQSARYVSGHIIYAEFVEFYDRLGGTRFVGNPLTGMRYNAELDRIEQYFENLGFYRLDIDPPGTVRLLSYGVFKCDIKCRYASNPFSIPEKQGILPEPFATAVARLGPSFVGRLLVDTPYQSEDGKTIVIFENAVLYTTLSTPNRVFALPIVEMVGTQPGNLVQKIDDERMTFYVIQGDLGHNIPTIFSDYMALHGGLDIFGIPITEISQIQERVYRQCFKNLCLEYHVNAPEALQIRPVPLGALYKQLFLTGGSLSPSPNIAINVSDDGPYASENSTPTIHVEILKNNTPLPAVVPSLILTLPDGSHTQYYFPGTGADGRATLQIDSIDAPNGTMIPYTVCLGNVTAQEICVEGNYFIWDMPN